MAIAQGRRQSFWQLATGRPARPGGTTAQAEGDLMPPTRGGRQLSGGGRGPPSRTLLPMPARPPGKATQASRSQSRPEGAVRRRTYLETGPAMSERLLPVALRRGRANQPGIYSARSPSQNDHPRYRLRFDAPHRVRRPRKNFDWTPLAVLLARLSDGTVRGSSDNAAADASSPASSSSSSSS